MVLRGGPLCSLRILPCSAGPLSQPLGFPFRRPSSEGGQPDTNTPIHHCRSRARSAHSSNHAKSNCLESLPTARQPRQPQSAAGLPVAVFAKSGLFFLSSPSIISPPPEGRPTIFLDLIPAWDTLPACHPPPKKFSKPSSGSCSAT